MNTLVSIIIPTHNYARYLGSCLDSVLAQTYSPIETIVCNDFSTDDTDAVVSKYLDKIKYISNVQNMGVSFTRNAGLKESSGEYIVFLDADDMLTPKSIAKRVEFLESHPEYCVVHGFAKKINEKRGNSEWDYKTCMEKFKELEAYSRDVNAQTIMWRRGIFKKYGGYFEGLKSKEDKEMLYRLGIHKYSNFRTGIKVYKIEDFVAIYRRHPAAKHKRRCADMKWEVQTREIFNRRIGDLVRSGITKLNTPHPI